MVNFKLPMTASFKRRGISASKITESELQSILSASTSTSVSSGIFLPGLDM